MHSQAITEFGKPLQDIETPTPTPTGTEVLLKVHNAGVCHSDVHIHDGYFDLGGGNKLPMANMKLPHTLGHEIEGEVVAVGPDVKDVKVGAALCGVPVDRLRQVRVVPARRGEHLRRRPAPARLLQRRPRRICDACDGAASEISHRLRQDRSRARCGLYVLGPHRLSPR